MNFYGETKLWGEQAILSSNPGSAIILRVPVLYRPILGEVDGRYGAGENNESAVNILIDTVMVALLPNSLILE